MAGRWGSFISGLESKLDTILADEDNTSKKPRDGTTSEHFERRTSSAVPAVPKGRADGPAATASMNRAQDRLNERLAKALANRTSSTGDSSALSSKVPSRTATPAQGPSSPRASTDSKEGTEIKTRTQSVFEPPEPNTTDTEISADQAEGTKLACNSIAIACSSGQRSIDLTAAQPTKQSLELSRSSTDIPESAVANGTEQGTDIPTSAELQQIIQQMRSDYEAAEAQRQEEMHEYLERIDALQSKLKYLTKEAAEMAKNVSFTADFGSTEQKLAAKDEKIALLMEEGYKLSETELKHMSIIKKLRAKSLEDEKQISRSMRLVERYDKDVKEAQERAKRAEAADRRATERIKLIPKLERDLEIMRAERDSRTSLIESLQKELFNSKEAAEEVDIKAKREALEMERKRNDDLAKELSSVKMEKEVAEKIHVAAIRELKERAERDKERSRVAEVERQGEQNILESRLEAFRARAEEASTVSTGDVQAKLLRQTETLQNQYAVAIENWQGIEASLLMRISALEKERNEASKREAEIRRKAREASLKSRRMEEEFERVTNKAQEFQRELTQQRAELMSTHEKLRKAEVDVAEARKNLQAEREAREAREAQCMEEEKAGQREELSRTPEALYQQSRTDSPITSSRNLKSSNPDKQSPHRRRYHGLAITGAPVERPVSRRSSTQPLHSAENLSLSRQGSVMFTQPSTVNGTLPTTPSITVHDQEDLFDGVRTPASPEDTINDMISASTGGAGPSIQLVERMSAAVRRLESEKATSRDELARLSQQRDEAREHVVSLLREAAEKRKLDERIKELEKGNQGIQERYLTTLEMLGEKSEKVEELKADVTDLKQMYRELVDDTMR